jgi:hypothetical protein
MQLAVRRWTLDTFSVIPPTKESLNMGKFGGSEVAFGGGEAEQAFGGGEVAFGGGEAERAFGGSELEAGASV